MDFSIAVGSFIPKIRKNSPIADVIIKGLVIIPFRVFLISSFPHLKISKDITANILKKGTTVAISIATTPTLSPLNREHATGRPNIIKLLRNIPCIKTPRFLLSFSIRGMRMHSTIKVRVTLISAKQISLGFIAPFKSVLYIL